MWTQSTKSDYASFFTTAVDAQCRTASIAWHPRADEAVWVHAGTLGAVLESNTFPAWFVDSHGRGGASFVAPDALSILLRDALLRADFLAQFMDGYDRSRGVIRSVSLVSLHCTACDHRVIVDGIHRITWLAAERDLDAVVTLTELSGKDWSCRTPDMNIVCSCLARR